MWPDRWTMRSRAAYILLVWSKPGFLPISYCVNCTDSEASHPQGLLGNQRKWQEAQSTPTSHSTSSSHPWEPRDCHFVHSYDQHEK